MSADIQAEQQQESVRMLITMLRYKGELRGAIAAAQDVTRVVTQMVKRDEAGCA